MALNEDGGRHQLRDYASYSSLPPELEIAVALKSLILPNKLVSLKPPKTPISPRYPDTQYINKPLPPIPSPPPKSAKRHLRHNGGSGSFDVTAAERIATFPPSKNGRDRSGSRSRRKIQKLTGHNLNVDTWQPRIEEAAKNSNKLAYRDPSQVPQITGLADLNHGVTFLDIPQIMRSNSLGSGGPSSQDNVLEEIVDSYSKRGSWAPDPKSPNSPTKRSLYLLPSLYSASENDLGCSGRTADVRRPDCASFDGTQNLSNTRTIIADLITEESERERLALDIGRSSQGNASTSVSLQRETFGYQSWNDDNIFGRRLTPQPLALRPRNFGEPRPSTSRFSDHSSEDDGGIISNARDSVISHIRSLSSPFKPPSRPAMVFRENASRSTIQLPLPEPVKRKRAFSSGWHPLKSPFPFRSPPHKRVRTEKSANSEESSFTRRISNIYGKLSGARTSPVIESRIISNHARSGDGPDTPMPTKPGFMGIMSPTSVFHKGTLLLQDAMQKAKSAAGVKSRDERWRDKMRSQIVVVGVVEPSPNRPAVRWF